MEEDPALDMKEEVSEDFESPDDVDVKDYKGPEDDTSSGGIFALLRRPM